MPSRKELDEQTQALLAAGEQKLAEQQAQESAAISGGMNQLSGAITEHQRRKKASADAAAVMKNQRKAPVKSKSFPSGRPRFGGVKPGR